MSPRRLRSKLPGSKTSLSNNRNRSLTSFAHWLNRARRSHDDSPDVALDLPQFRQSDEVDERPDDANESTSEAPFEILHHVSAGNILQLIIDEHPQTIALVISHLPAPLAADVIGGFTAHTQLDIIRRVSNIEQPDRDIIHDVETSLERSMKSMLRLPMHDEQPVLT